MMRRDWGGKVLELLTEYALRGGESESRDQEEVESNAG
jgi:hypothetical protein